MHSLIGPVITSEGGYAFDLWTSERGLSRSFRYLRVEDAHYARRFEIRSHGNGPAGAAIACATVAQFASALQQRTRRTATA
jgi:hypothetical protein